MTNLEIIAELKSSVFFEEDEASYQLEFQGGLTDAEIEELKSKFPSQYIHPDIIEILKATKGWDGYGPEMVYFDSIGEFGFYELSPYSLTLGHDGFGNSWILDIDKNGNLGKIFYACHDPAVFVIHSQNLNEFLTHLLAYYKNPGVNHLNTIHDTTVFEIWQNNSNILDIAEYRKSNPKYDAFLNQFDGDNWVVADITSTKNGDGFAWGKFGPNQYTQRHPDELIWVIKKKENSFFQKLFSK